MAGSSSSSSYSVSGDPLIEQLSEQYMQQQYEWGQQQFQKNSQLTDQVVGDLMNLYGSLSGVGSTLMSEYNNMFVPEYQKLVQDANSYSGQARIQQAMGAAESGVSQNFNGQRNAALADLQSFGIDPSSGRYAQLDSAERMQEAAAAAGAGFQAEQATEATGRALRSEALQLGSVMPSQATAAYNAAQGAATAGENAKLANSQEGVNMMGSPTAWGALGMQKRSAANANGSYKSPNDNKNPGSGNGSNRNSTGDDSGFGKPSPPIGRGGAGNGGTPTITSFDAPQAPQSPGLPESFGGVGTDTWTQPEGSQQNDANGDPWTQATGGPNQDWGDATSVDTSGPQDFAQPTDQNGWDLSGDAGFNDIGGGGGSDQQGSDQSDSTDYSGDSSQSDYSGDTSGGPSDDWSEDDSGGGGDDSDSFAKGGAVPYSKSPSGGRKVDDVAARLHGTGEPIRLNAGEFIMPRHTVKWFGEKHFQDLIAKSKKARGEAPGKPTMKPALPAHHMGALHG